MGWQIGICSRCEACIALFDLLRRPNIGMIKMENLCDLELVEMRNLDVGVLGSGICGSGWDGGDGELAFAAGVRRDR